MTKIVLLGANTYRVIKRRRNAITLQPVGNEYPLHHFSATRRDEVGAFAHGSDRGSPADWYKQVDAETFQKIGSGKW